MSPPFLEGWRQEADKENALMDKTVFSVIATLQHATAVGDTVGQVIIYSAREEGMCRLETPSHTSPVLHRSLPVTSAQFNGTSVQLLEVSGGKN